MVAPILIEARYRSDLEKKVAAQLEAAGVPFDYESLKVEYTVPARDAKYLPDFVIPGTNILIEAKGRFGGGNPSLRLPTSDGAKERQKLILIKEQHPELDIRIVFQRAATPIYRGSKTTYAKWADDHGFKWSDKGIVPAEWLEEIAAQQRANLKEQPEK